MKKLTVLILLVAPLMISFCCQKESAVTHKVKETPDLLAQINGKPLYEKDLDLRSQTQLYDKKKQIVETYVRGKKFDDYLAKSGYKRQDFFEKEIKAKATKPSEAEIKKFYDERGIKQPYDKVKPQIERSLQTSKMRDRQKDFFDGLMKGSEIVYYFAPPKANIVMWDDDVFTGAKDAPVVMVEYTDFQCPFCSRSQGTIKELKTKYGNKLKHVFRHYPIPSHAGAKPGALASMCANDQGKFWEYHDVLFEKAREINDENIIKWAEELKLDMPKFKKCFTEKKYDAYVDKHFKSGQEYGVSSTPSFFINGIPVIGAKPKAEFETIIDEALKAAKK